MYLLKIAATSGGKYMTKVDLLHRRKLRLVDNLFILFMCLLIPRQFQITEYIVVPKQSNDKETPGTQTSSFSSQLKVIFL